MLRQAGVVPTDIASCWQLAPAACRHAYTCELGQRLPTSPVGNRPWTRTCTNIRERGWITYWRCLLSTGGPGHVSAHMYSGELPQRLPAMSAVHNRPSCVPKFMLGQAGTAPIGIVSYQQPAQMCTDSAFLKCCTHLQASWHNTNWNCLEHTEYQGRSSGINIAPKLCSRRVVVARANHVRAFRTDFLRDSMRSYWPMPRRSGRATGQWKESDLDMELGTYQHNFAHIPLSVDTGAAHVLGWVFESC